MRRKIAVFFTAILMALAMAAPAAAHPNSASGKGVAVAPAAGGLVGQGHFLGLQCVAESGKTPIGLTPLSITCVLGPNN